MPKAATKAGKAPTKKTANTGRAAAPAPAPPKPTPVGRLGDDVAPKPGTAVKFSREPLSVILARTDVVAGGVRIKALAPSSLRVARGQVIHIKHAYRLQENSPEREEYRFLLKSTLAGRQHQPSLARLGDQWGVPEDIGGYLQHEYTCNQPGRHVLEFEIGSEYCIMGWGDSTVQALDRKELKGKLDVFVG